MATKVEKSIVVNVPVSTAYNQWTQFADFPQFMNGVQRVTQLGNDRMEWVAEIGGVKRQWEAQVLEQVPDQKVSWAATSGATNAGEVTFADLGGSQTRVNLSLDYEPEGLVEKIGDKLNFVEKQAEGDLERFKAFIESEGYATGAWRGSINEGGQVGTPTAADAGASQGDSGKAGVSGKTVATGLGAAAAAAVVAGAAGAAAKKSDSDTVEATRESTTREAAPTVVESPAGTPSPAPTTGQPGPAAVAPTSDAIEDAEVGVAVDPTLQPPDNRV